MAKQQSIKKKMTKCIYGLMAQLGHFFTMHRHPLACSGYCTNHTQPPQTLPERPKHELSMEIRYRRKPRTAESRVYVRGGGMGGETRSNYIEHMVLLIQHVLNHSKQTCRTLLTSTSKAYLIDNHIRQKSG